MKPSETLNKLKTLWNIDLTLKSPIEVKGVGRLKLAEAFNTLDFNEGVEIGTEEGVYAEYLFQANPNLHLTCVDPWLTYSGYREHVTQPVMDAIFELAQDLLAPHNVTFLRMFSLEALTMVPDESLDFVYIDGNHDLPNTIQDIVGWSKKVKSGGIISGHDYIHNSPNDREDCHVMEATRAYTSSYRIREWFILGRKLWERGEVRDKPRSWMWIKP